MIFSFADNGFLLITYVKNIAKKKKEENNQQILNSRVYTIKRHSIIVILHIVA